MKNFFSSLKVFAFLSTLSLLTSCAFFMASAGAAIGSGLYAFVNDDIKATENIAIHDAWEATRKTLVELGFYDIEEGKEGNMRKLTAKTVDQQLVVIRLEEQTEHVTTFRVRVGMIGNKDVASFIYAHIKRNLAKISQA